MLPAQIEKLLNLGIKYFVVKKFYNIEQLKITVMFLYFTKVLQIFNLGLN